MKILIAYYSKTNHTRELAGAVKKEFENRGHDVDIEEVRPVKEHSFWGWWHIRYFEGECDIQPPIIKDASRYDVICIGSPNWTRLSLPMARYLKEMVGLTHKNIGLFSTTALWPPIEWYFFSAYLLDLTFTHIVEAKKGRVMDSIMLSGWFKRWGAGSGYGRRRIKEFCDKMEAPIVSFKDYILKQKEIEGARSLIVIFTILLLLSLTLQIITSGLGFIIFSWDEYFSLFFVGVATCFLILVLMERKVGFFLGKYIAGISAVIMCTLLILYLELSFGRYIIVGYVLVLTIVGFFRDPKAVMVAGAGVILGYFYLVLKFPLRWVLRPQLDISLIIMSAVMISIITNNLQRHFTALVESQDEIEAARATLEARVVARTKELKSLADTLDEQVKQRTRELNEKVKELERFQKFTVGREVKMIELKGRIKEMEEESKKMKGS